MIEISQIMSTVTKCSVVVFWTFFTVCYFYVLSASSGVQHISGFCLHCTSFTLLHCSSFHFSDVDFYEKDNNQIKNRKSMKLMMMMIINAIYIHTPCTESEAQVHCHPFPEGYVCKLEHRLEHKHMTEALFSQFSMYLYP